MDATERELTCSKCEILFFHTFSPGAEPSDSEVCSRCQKRAIDDARRDEEGNDRFWESE